MKHIEPTICIRELIMHIYTSIPCIGTYIKKKEKKKYEPEKNTHTQCAVNTLFIVEKRI